MFTYWWKVNYTAIYTHNTVPVSMRYRFWWKWIACMAVDQQVIKSILMQRHKKDVTPDNQTVRVTFMSWWCVYAHECVYHLLTNSQAIMFSLFIAGNSHTAKVRGHFSEGVWGCGDWWMHHPQKETHQDTQRFFSPFWALGLQMERSVQISFWDQSDLTHTALLI